MNSISPAYNFYPFVIPPRYHTPGAGKHTTTILLCQTLALPFSGYAKAGAAASTGTAGRQAARRHTKSTRYLGRTWLRNRGGGAFRNKGKRGNILWLRRFRRSRLSIQIDRHIVPI
jgi:hypothetical protein